jgi:hypothetical protein
MKSIWHSRRTFISFLGILALLVLGFKGEEVGFHIVAIVLGIVGANAAEGALSSGSLVPKLAAPEPEKKPSRKLK